MWGMVGIGGLFRGDDDPFQVFDSSNVFEGFWATLLIYLF